MPVEILVVAGNALIHFVLLFFVQQLYNDFAKGVPWALSNREDQTHGEFAKRVQRTIANHAENTLIFVPLALAVVMLEASTYWTQVGAVVFIVGRAAYAVLYVAGVPYLRSGVWMLGVLGYWMMGYRLAQLVIYGS